MGPSAYIGVRHRLFSSDPSRPICWYFCWYRENKRSRRLSLFRTKGIEQMPRKNAGACANPKQIRTDVDCRAARPKFDNGAWSPAKISDVTGGGLYLFVTPDESRLCHAGFKLRRMGYRCHSRQKTYSIGPYGNGKDGTFSLADARRERDKAKDLLKEGKDPSTEKDAPLSNNTLNKRLRLLGIDTKTDHCAHGFRTTFSTLSHHEEIKDAKA